MTLRYSFDSLAIRGGRIFGWGWFLCNRSAATRLELVVEHADGGVSRIRCLQSGHRPDLAEAFPDVSHASAGGFLMEGRLEQKSPAKSSVLHAWLEDGSQESVDVPGFPGQYLSSAPSLLGSANTSVADLVDILRHGGIRALPRRVWGALRRGLTRLRSRLIALVPYIRRARVDVIVFDHALGGGANRFRDAQIREWVCQGRNVLLVSPELPTLSYQVLRFGRVNWFEYFPSLDTCLAALGPASEIVVNDLVSFDDPLLILDWIAARKLEQASRLRFFVHDYHAVCPSWTLVDNTNRYCGIPSLETCARCLPDNDAAFLSLLPRLDVPDWRQHWRRFLLSADEIVAFSSTSVAILRKAYPELPAERIRVLPHDTTYVGTARARPSLDGPLVIGVVGAINLYKGAKIVAEMARIIEAEDWPARIVVIGSIDGVRSSPALEVTGAYSMDRLPALLEQHRVSLCLLPSICHETFSYVTSELLAMGMPLASFDMGAPAERIRSHALGCIIGEVDARIALESLSAFHRTLQLGQGGGNPDPMAANK